MCCSMVMVTSQAFTTRYGTTYTCCPSQVTTWHSCLGHVIKHVNLRSLLYACVRLGLGHRAFGAPVANASQPRTL